MIDPSTLDPLSQEDFRQVLDALDTEARALAHAMGANWDQALGPQAGRHSITTQVLAIARSGLFDAEHYLATNPDLAALGLNALRHYVEYGDAEGRWPNACFNPKAYRGYFPDGALKGICALYHYAVLGEALGLGAPPDFDGQRYLATYPALAPWLDRPLCHFLNVGRHHGMALHHRIRLSADQRVQVREKPPTTSIERQEDNPLINVVGPLDKVSGLGVSARGYLRGLREAGFTRLGTMCQPLAFPRQSAIPPGELPLPPFIQDALINVVHMNGDTLPLMLEHGGGHELLDGAHNIAVWYWELPVLRPEWHASLKYFNEFWAPTPFIADTLRSATSKPVTLMPPYLKYLETMPVRKTQDQGHPRYFVYCFDANSILERKNPLALVKAFEQAFPDHDEHGDVELVLKVTYPNREIEEVDALYQHSASNPRIKVVDELLATADLHDLIANSLAYVSPHRSEGLGLTVIEAMAAQVPIITTSFGGLASFVDSATAWPVAFNKVELPAEYHPYPKGFVWVDPDIDSMADQMHQVVRSPEEAAMRAATARQRVLDYFCSDRLIKQYQSAFKRKQQ